MQVWLGLALVALMFIGMMCWFSWIYTHRTAFHRNSVNQPKTSLEELTKNIGYYTIYVTNILTNHGSL